MPEPTVTDSAENAELCACPGCPSYKACMKAENSLLYCARGGTGCVPVREGCVCPGCPVYRVNALEHTYWCFG